MRQREQPGGDHLAAGELAGEEHFGHDALLRKGGRRHRSKAAMKPKNTFLRAGLRSSERHPSWMHEHFNTAHLGLRIIADLDTLFAEAAECLSRPSSRTPGPSRERTKASRSRSLEATASTCCSTGCGTCGIPDQDRLLFVLRSEGAG